MLRRRVVWRVQDRVLETLHPSSSLQLIGGLICHAAAESAYDEQSPHIRRIGMAARRTEAHGDFQRLPLAALSVRNRRFKRERQSLLDRGYHSRLHLRPSWPLAATTDENGGARPSSAFLGAVEPKSQTDAGAVSAPRTVCCEHVFQR